MAATVMLSKRYILYILLFVTLTGIFHSISAVIADSELILVQIVFRHGDRSAVNTFPTDKYTESDWPQGFGQLTKRGMEQHYELGSYFRARYIDGNSYSFLNESYKQKEVYVRSTDYDRTLMSAYCDLAGLYPPANGSQWHSGIEWQPIPVHTEPKSSDKLLYMTFPCPKADQLYQEMLHSDRVKKEEEDNKEFYRFVSNKTGVANETVDSVWKAYDTIFCEGQHPELGFQPYSWLNKTFGNKTVFQKLQELEAFQFDVMFDTAAESRLRGGPLVGEMVSNMQAKVLGQMDPPERKLFMYSAHDSTLVAFASALKVFNKKAPPYASAILVELHRASADGAYSVRLLYHNTTGLPNVLSLPGCAELCPLDQFVALTKDAIPVDLDSECQVSAGIIGDHELLIAILVSVAGLLLIITVVTVLVCRKKRSVPYYRYTGLEDAA